MSILSLFITFRSSENPVIFGSFDLLETIMLNKLHKNYSGWTTSCDEEVEVGDAKAGEVQGLQNPTDDVIRLLSESQEIRVPPYPAAAALPIAGVLPDPLDPVDRFADVTNERMKRAEYLVTEWLTKWWGEFEEDMVRYVQ